MGIKGAFTNFYNRFGKITHVKEDKPIAPPEIKTPSFVNDARNSEQDSAAYIEKPEGDGDARVEFAQIDTSVKDMIKRLMKLGKNNETLSAREWHLFMQKLLQYDPTIRAKGSAHNDQRAIANHAATGQIIRIPFDTYSRGEGVPAFYYDFSVSTNPSMPIVRNMSLHSLREGVALYLGINGDVRRKITVRSDNYVQGEAAQNLVIEALLDDKTPLPRGFDSKMYPNGTRIEEVIKKENVNKIAAITDFDPIDSIMQTTPKTETIWFCTEAMNVGRLRADIARSKACKFGGTLVLIRNIADFKAFINTSNLATLSDNNKRKLAEGRY